MHVQEAYIALLSRAYVGLCAIDNGYTVYLLSEMLPLRSLSRPGAFVARGLALGLPPPRFRGWQGKVFLRKVGASWHLCRKPTNPLIAVRPGSSPTSQEPPIGFLQTLTLEGGPVLLKCVTPRAGGFRTEESLPSNLGMKRKLRRLRCHSPGVLRQFLVQCGCPSQSDRAWDSVLCPQLCILVSRCWGLSGCQSKKLFLIKNFFQSKRVFYNHNTLSLCNRREEGSTEEKKAGRKEGRQEGRKEGEEREGGRTEGRKEGRKQGRKEGRQEGRKAGRQAGRREGRQEGRKEGSWAARKARTQAERTQGRKT